MITTNEQAYDLPTAQELEQLANSLFPDLIPEVQKNAEFCPTSSGQEYFSNFGSQGQSAAAAEAGREPGAPVTADEYSHFATEESPVYGEYQNHAENTLSTYGNVPKAESFASFEDPFLSEVNEPASPAGIQPKDVRQGEALQKNPKVDYSAVSYSPKVYSQEEGQKASKAINAPTSLGGDRKTSFIGEKGSSRNSSIVIGSKTLQQIRDDFPILQEKINGNNLVWLDNGATTQRPRQVIDRITYYYEHENSNVHRGAHTLAARSTDAYENARDTVARFIGAPSSSNIVFVRGTTEAINLVANAYVKPTLQPGDEIIVSLLEHHANIVPWQLVAEETGAVIKVIPVNDKGELLLGEYEKLFTKRTKFVSVTQVSNVTGTITPVEELIAIAHRHGVRILIDGAQSIAHIPVNVSASDADFYVFSGHKVYGPTGIGGVYGKKELLEAARPYHGGGNMIADVTFERTLYNPAPNKFEAGTGSIADAIGLGAALEYLEGIGMASVAQWEHELTLYAVKEMKTVKGLHFVGSPSNKAGVLSFKLDGHDDEEVGQRLNSYGIAVRTGHHCAQPILRHFGFEGSIRPTLAIYNSPDDVDALVKVLHTF
ncbi:cysteine desulfurase [Treponema zioleckii]|uniref:cysteine desulfurase n=1 Tax=Treponema zioleckii TaxID=331680 RepID=UPI00168ABDAB|nr:cysteine desulfurase [Treponema zioleckii]